MIRIKTPIASYRKSGYIFHKEKNMHTDKSGGLTETQAKNYIEKTEKTTGQVNDRLPKFNQKND